VVEANAPDLAVCSFSSRVDVAQSDFAERARNPDVAERTNVAASAINQAISRDDAVRSLVSADGAAESQAAIGFTRSGEDDADTRGEVPLAVLASNARVVVLDAHTSVAGGFPFCQSSAADERQSSRSDQNLFHFVSLVDQRSSIQE